MKRRTVDHLFVAGGVGLAALLLVLAVVMTSNANFAKMYVRDQLTQQNISFPPKSALTADEAKSPCLVSFAGQRMTNGRQAECYANDFIGLHVKAIADGKTYADLGAPQAALKTQIATLQSTDPSLPALQTQLTAITGQRESLFKGETLRGLLLTSFGFSVFGVKGAQAATAAYGAGAVMALLALAGLVHAMTTANTAAFAATEPIKPTRKPKHLATVPS